MVYLMLFAGSLCAALLFAVFAIFAVFFLRRQGRRWLIELLAPNGGSPEAWVGVGTTRPRRATVVTPSRFNGKPEEFKEWCFKMELALRTNEVEQSNQVDFSVNFLEGNALLWLIASRENGTVFHSWQELKEALANTLGPLRSAEENRLDLFSLRQEASLEDYIGEFCRISLHVEGIDDHSRAVLLVQGLKPHLRMETLREHPETLSEAINAARTAERAFGLMGGRIAGQPIHSKSGSQTSSVRPGGRNLGKFSNDFGKDTRLAKLSAEERTVLMREGRCFKCRLSGHLSKDCPSRVSSPNVNRQ